MEARIVEDKDLQVGQQYIEIAGEKIPFPAGFTISITFTIILTIAITINLY